MVGAFALTPARPGAIGTDEPSNIFLDLLLASPNPLVAMLTSPKCNRVYLSPDLGRPCNIMPLVVVVIPVFGGWLASGGDFGTTDELGGVGSRGSGLVEVGFGVGGARVVGALVYLGTAVVAMVVRLDVF